MNLTSEDVSGPLMCTFVSGRSRQRTIKSESSGLQTTFNCRKKKSGESTKERMSYIKKKQKHASGGGSSYNLALNRSESSHLGLR